MEQTDQTIAELNRKIDLLAAQVQYLAEQARVAELARQERAELMQDAAPIARDAIQLAGEHLQEIEAYVKPADLVRLLKKLARAAPYLETLLDELDGVKDLVEIAGPIGKEALGKAEAVLDAAERKGYFVFARGGLQIADHIVNSFTEEDVRQLGDNIVLILRTVKEMTQPEVMNFLRSTVAVAGQELEGPVDISYRALFRQIRDPNVRRGLALTLRMMRGIGAESGRA